MKHFLLLCALAVPAAAQPAVGDWIVSDSNSAGGGLYAVTTNPGAVRGEGLGLAALAGATIADPEFVQFHPTAVDLGLDPAPLASEALRGEGAVLVEGTVDEIRSDARVRDVYLGKRHHG